MEFFDNLGKTIAEKSKEAAKKAKDITETLQLKAQITTEKNGIQDVYTQIGKKFYDENQSAADESYIEYFDKVRLSLEKVTQLENEINAIEGIRICDSCGTKISAEACFCTGCGKSMEPIVKEEDIIVETEINEENEEVESMVIEENIIVEEDEIL